MNFKDLNHHQIMKNYIKENIEFKDKIMMLNEQLSKI